MRSNDSSAKRVEQHIVRSNMAQAEAARQLGVTQPRVSDPMRGRINLFGRHALVNMASAAGMRLKLQLFEVAGRG